MMELLSMDGNVLWRKERQIIPQSGGTFSMSLDQFPNGIYFVKITNSKTGKLFTEKLVISK